MAFPPGVSESHAQHFASLFLSMVVRWPRAMLAWPVKGVWQVTPTRSELEPCNFYTMEQFLPCTFDMFPGIFSLQMHFCWLLYDGK